MMMTMTPLHTLRGIVLRLGHRRHPPPRFPCYSASTDCSVKATAVFYIFLATFMLPELGRALEQSTMDEWCKAAYCNTEFPISSSRRECCIQGYAWREKRVDSQFVTCSFNYPNACKNEKERRAFESGTCQPFPCAFLFVYPFSVALPVHIQN